MAHGGQRPNAGRKRGTPNKATAEIKAVAQQYGASAIDQVVKIMTKCKNEAARIAACKELLDRGYGKAPQAITGDPDSPELFPSEIQIRVISPTIDKPPAETREEWIARRKRELAAGRVEKQVAFFIKLVDRSMPDRNSS